jgi:hypothetical protein
MASDHWRSRIALFPTHGLDSSRPKAAASALVYPDIMVIAVFNRSERRQAFAYISMLSIRSKDIKEQAQQDLRISSKIERDRRKEICLRCIRLWLSCETGKAKETVRFRPRSLTSSAESPFAFTDVTGSGAAGAKRLYALSGRLPNALAEGSGVPSLAGSSGRSGKSILPLSISPSSEHRINPW